MEQPSVEIPLLSSREQRRSGRLQAVLVQHDSISTSRANTPTANSNQSTPAIQSSRSTPGERFPDLPENESIETEPPDSTPSKRTGLRRNRKDSKAKGSVPDPMEAAMKPLTDEERRSWPGWVELESEPVSFERERKPLLSADWLFFFFVLRFTEQN